MVAIALMTAGAWAYQAGCKALESSAYLKIRSVEFDPQDNAVKEEDLPFRPGDYLFGFSAPVLRGEILAKYPQLLDVRFSRTLRRVVAVHSVLRSPLGVIEKGDDIMAVDLSGTFFPAPADKTLPVIDDELAQDPAVLGFLEQLQQIHPRWFGTLAEVHRTPAGLLRFVLRDGTEVLWGFLDSGSVVQKARRLDRVLYDTGLSRKGFEYVRFVDTDRIVVKKRR